MEKLENVVEVLDVIRIEAPLRPHNWWYGLEVMKGLPLGIKMVTRYTDKFGSEYRIYLEKDINLEKLGNICNKKGYKACLYGNFLRVGDIYVEKNFVLFKQKQREKVSIIINAYLKSKCQKNK